MALEMAIGFAGFGMGFVIGFMTKAKCEQDGGNLSRDAPPKARRDRSPRKCLLMRRHATTVIGVAIFVVLCIHWQLAIHHTRNSRPHDVFLSSFLEPRPEEKIAGMGAEEKIVEMAPEEKIIEMAPEGKIIEMAPPYILSPICGGCYRSFYDHRPCFTIIQKDQRSSKGRMSLLKATRKLGRESAACGLCNPDRCREHYFGNSTRERGSYQSKYWRFDRSGPEFANPTTLALNSIPSELRIPASRFRDIGAYFAEKYAYSKANNASMDYLVEYNPGIVALPEEARMHLPREAAYLLSLRVTPANNCFSERDYADLPKDVWEAVYHTSTNHLGLALLDENYQIISGHDVVVEVDVQLDLKRSTTSKAGEAVSPTFMDYRLFVLNNEIYLHVNADTVIVNRLSLSSKGFGGDDARLRDIASCVSVAEEAGELGSWEKPCRLEILYGGDHLQVTLMRQFNTIWTGGNKGKNYALFAVPNATHPESPDSVYAEIDIFPHHVQQIIPDRFNQLSKFQVFGKIWKEGTRKRRNFKIDRVNMRAVVEVGNATESGDPPLPSFSTVDAHADWFPGADAPFKEAAHGGACCVRFSAAELNLGGAKNNHRQPLLVGIGHTKVTWKPWYNKANVPREKKDLLPHTHYVSLFYAFDPFPPFQVRARSGYFCLGHAPPSSGDELPPAEGGTFNPHSVLTRNRMLRQNNLTFDCPQMHFVSSFIQKAGDASKSIIGYGLNDCTGRLVEVEKKEIVRLLYPRPMDMIFEVT